MYFLSIRNSNITVFHGEKRYFVLLPIKVFVSYIFNSHCVVLNPGVKFTENGCVLRSF